MKNSDITSGKQPQLINRGLESLIEEIGLRCIILNPAHEIGHIYGEVSKYMKPFSPGKFSSRIGDHIIDSLAVPLNTALGDAESGPPADL